MDKEQCWISRSSEGQGLDLSNIVCEYEVNMSTNEKVINEKHFFYTNG